MRESGGRNRWERTESGATCVEGVAKGWTVQGRHGGEGWAFSEPSGRTVGYRRTESGAKQAAAAVAVAK